MKNVIRIVANIICILLGGTLFVLGITEVMDEFFDDETMDLETARAMLHQTVREEYAKP